MNREYNLSGERYREGTTRASYFPTLPLGDLCELIGGSTPSRENDSYWNNGAVKWISSKHIDERGNITGYELISKKAIEETSTRVAPKGSTIIITRVSVGKFAFVDDEYAINQDLTALISKDEERLAPDFIRVVAHHIASVVERSAEGIGVRGVTRNFLSELQIPVPPLDVQKGIVAEIEGYQKVIDGARAVLDNYRPHIPIHPDWPMVQLGEICEFKNGLNFNKNSSDHAVKIVGVADFQNNLFAPLEELQSVHLDAPLGEEYLLKEGDILFVRSNGNPDLVGRSVIVPKTNVLIAFSGFTIRARIHDGRALALFLAHFFKSRDFAERIKTVGRGANIRNLSQGILSELMIPLPPFGAQRAIVAEIEAEQALVNANRELISRMTKKIQATLARVWGEDKPTAAEA